MGLTKRTIEATAYAGRVNGRHVLWDDDPIGLGLRVFPSGRKTFVLSYRVAGRKRLLTLGDLGVLTLDSARRRARKELLSVENDAADPLAERRQRELDATTGSIKELFLAYVECRKPKQRRKLVREAERNIFPAFAVRSWRAVRRSEVRMWHSSFVSPYVANRSLQALRAALYWRIWQEDDSPGESTGRCQRDTRNPCAGIKLRPERRRQVRLELSQVPNLEQAIVEECADPYVRAYFRFLIAMGCRMSEALTIRWADVALSETDSTVVFCDTKNGEDRIIPLPATIVAELTALPRVDGNPFVFVGRTPGQPLKAVSKAWQRIRTRARLPHLRLHDLRRSFGSWLGDAGFTSKQIGTVLGHKTDITSRVYMALGHESKRAAVDAVQVILAAARSRQDADTTVTVLQRKSATA